MWTNEYQPPKHKFQVLLSVHNSQEYLERCLKSLDESLKHYDWILLYGDDGSTDDTNLELAKYARSLTCDKVHLYEYKKAKTVGQAKNRLIKESKKFKKQYPYILFMDSDDEMLPERPKMAETAELTNSYYVVGSWQRKGNNGKKIISGQDSAKRLSYGPWATLFHSNFFTDRPFFPEEEVFNTGYEDILAWYHLKYIENQSPTIHESLSPVHRYIIRSESACQTRDIKTLNHNRNVFWGVSRLIKEQNRNIFTNPPSRQETLDAKDAYIKSKEQEASPDPH